MEYKGFCGAAYTLQNISADCQRCVNLYPQPDESGVGKNRAYLLSTPGLQRVADLTGTSGTENGSRGTYTASNERFFAVAGAFLFELDSAFTVLGSYALPNETGLGPVSMTDNGQDMMIATGPNGYWFNFAANTLTQIADAVFLGATTCGFIDGFIVFNQPNSQIFWKTNLYSTVIDPLGFASAEGNPDNLVSLLCDHREIWLFGTISTEVWYDSGGANFPFSFIQGAYISHGIAAAFSAVRLDNTTFWLGNDEFGHGVAYRANGYAPVRISTFAMEQAWQRYPTIADAVAWTYQQDGHAFYVLNFPSGDATWVYDAATGLWHERAYLGTLAFNDGALHRGRPNTHSFAFGKHIVGDWETGYLYQMSPLFLDDDTREIQRMRRAPVIDSELKRVLYSQFQLDMEVGAGKPPPPPPPPAPVYPDPPFPPPDGQSVGFAVPASMISSPSFRNGPNIFTGGLLVTGKVLGEGGFTSLEMTNGAVFSPNIVTVDWSDFVPQPEIPPGATITGVYPMVEIGGVQAGGFEEVSCTSPGGGGIIPLVTGFHAGPNIGSLGGLTVNAVVQNTLPGAATLSVDVGFVGAAIYYDGLPIPPTPPTPPDPNDPNEAALLDDPLINLRWSDDGGYTWSNYYSISMGAMGQYRKRINWRRLGSSRQRVFEVSTSQFGVGLSLYNAYLELTGMAS